MIKDKGKALNEKIKQELNHLPNDKHNAIEKILFTEYLIRDAIKKELNKVLKEKQLNVLKGVVIKKDENKKGKPEGIGDCDLIIYQKGKEEVCYGELVVVKGEFVKGIISVSTRLIDLKNKLQFDALLRQRDVCCNVIALCRRGEFSGKRKDEKLKEGQRELKNKIKVLEKKSIRIYVLEKEGDFDKLIKYIEDFCKY
jgi:hypothetical protein